jgi:RNA polymerase sigma-70 factor (sigma-E family)
MGRPERLGGMQDSTDIDALYRQHSRAAYGLAYVLTSNPTLAEDLVHDAFIAVVAKRGQLRDPNAFAAYLRRAVINAANSHFRRHKVAMTFVERGPDPSNHDAADPAGFVGMEHTLAGALRRLPERQRLAIVCRFYLDMSEQQTADALACRPGTAKALVSRGLAALREQTGLLSSLQE